MLIEQQHIMPQFTFVTGVIEENSEYGYEAGLLYSYQIIILSTEILSTKILIMTAKSLLT
jgi:hypothetical protein